MFLEVPLNEKFRFFIPSLNLTAALETQDQMDRLTAVALG